MPREDTQFKPGQSGNPKGRPPKGYSITEFFREMLAAKPEVKEALTKSILKKALSGDTAAQKMIWQYMDGMPPQTLKHSGLIGNINLDESPDALKTLFATFEIARENTEDEKLPKKTRKKAARKPHKKK